MCFSAQASFIAAAGLIATGGYCIYRSIHSNTDYLPLAMIPFFFGIQQFFEGQVWLSLHAQNYLKATMFSYGFLFFALAFWPFLFPFATYKIEKNIFKRTLFRYITIFMGLYGIYLFSSLFYGIGLGVTITNQSILYIYDPMIPRLLAKLIYLIGALPMMMSSNKNLNQLGYVTVASALIIYAINQINWTSIWCFAMAIISSFILYIIVKQTRHQTTENRLSPL